MVGIVLMNNQGRYCAEPEPTPFDFLARHVIGDDGNLDEHDKQANREAIEHGGRILSSYILAGGEKLYVITEDDRTVTTVLLSDEY